MSHDEELENAETVCQFKQIMQEEPKLQGKLQKVDAAYICFLERLVAKDSSIDKK